jgi:hypothetical protein
MSNTHAGVVYIVTAMKGGEAEYRVAANPRDQALAAVREHLAPGWTSSPTDQRLPPQMVAQLEMRANSVRKLKVGQSKLV